MLIETPTISFLLLILTVLRINCGKQPMPQETRAYLDAFRNIPKLFDYLLETLDERPEILENNDAVVFKRNADIQNDDTVSNAYLFKRDADYENEVTEYFGDNQHDENNNENEEISATNAEDNLKYVDSDIVEQDLEEYVDEKNTQAYYGSEYNMFTTLTSDEVAEYALEVEKMLEEQNNRK